MGLVYHTSNVIMKGELRLYGDWRVEGAENVPPTGPLLVVANHQSNIDPPLLAAALPRRIYFMAKRGLFSNPLSSLFLRSYGAFPLNRDGTDLAALQWSLRMLQQNAVLGVFPEGTRSPGAMRKAIPGVSMIALRSGAPILPVGITGSERLGPMWRVLLPTGKLRVRIGQPFSLPKPKGKLSREQLEATTTAIMERVAALLPESYRGVYALKGESPLSVGGGEVDRRVK
ncbi:MAG: 1-acyl-sn-glycerol-3-phosphate acyltransferase [Dehalococcoidia bacterium]|nr:1-acyl-sn-glycerol-3-phosphate acyltransferase [Dehalococcoidia bacterium]